MVSQVCYPSFKGLLITNVIQPEIDCTKKMRKRKIEKQKQKQTKTPEPPVGAKRHALPNRGSETQPLGYSWTP